MQPRESELYNQIVEQEIRDIRGKKGTDDP
jgi:hypothetical protein